MGRKKEDRQAKADHKKARRLANEAESSEDDSISLAHQLAPLGLQVREIPGDGNCLFRAVCDQLEGNSRNHLEYRVNTVEYMKHFRDDFEPFVEDDVPFDRHMALLRKSGTFAGNDALVALARYLKISIVIHQNGQPVWQINGCPDEGAKARQIHLSYHNGEHYNSVRRVGDHSNAPSTIVCGKTVSSRPSNDGKCYNEELTDNKPKPKAGSDDNARDDKDFVVNDDSRFEDSRLQSPDFIDAADEVDVLIDEVAEATGMNDRSHVRRLLIDHNLDVSAVIQFYTFTALADEEEDVEKGSREEKESDEKYADGAAAPSSAARTRMSRPEAARSKVKSTKEKRKEKREEKKARQAERNRRKFVGDDEELPEDDVHVLTQEIKCLDL